MKEQWQADELKAKAETTPTFKQATGDNRANAPAKKTMRAGVITALVVVVLAVIIFGLVNHERAKQAERDRIAADAKAQSDRAQAQAQVAEQAGRNRSQRINDMKQILLACKLFQGDNSDHWPDSLTQTYIYIGGGILLERLNQYLYEKPVPPAERTVPGIAKVLFEKTPTNANEEVVGFEVDGSVQVLTNAVDRWESYYWRGDEKSDERDLDGAIADFSKSIELNPKRADTYEMRAIVERQKGDLDAAMADCLKEIEIDPSYDLAYYMRGVLEYDKNEFDASLADFNKCIELRPNFARTYYLRANTKRAPGRRERGHRGLQKIS